MRLHPSIRRASQRLNSIHFATKAAMRLLTFALFVILLICLFPALATAASPHIYDVPQAGPPGSQTRTVGNGWDANATLDIYFDSTDVGLVDTDNNGSFGMALRAPTIRQNGLSIQIPNAAVPGQHWITAVERITQLQAQVAFTVSGDWVQFHFGPERTGFNPYEHALSPDTVKNLTLKWQASIGASRNPPVVANGMVYVGGWDVNSGTALFTLNASTGAVQWTFPTQDWIDRTSPAVADGIVYVGVGETGGPLYAVNASTGAWLWQYWVGGSIANSPAVANGIVYVLGSYDATLSALDARTGTLLWAYPTGYDPHLSSPAVANGIVYLGPAHIAATFQAVNANTGALLWQFGWAYGWGSPAVANGVVYVDGNDGSDHLYALNASTGALLWEDLIPEGVVYSKPAVANGVVYVGTWTGKVYALNASTGAILWTSATEGGINSSPAVANGVVYVGSLDHKIYAFNATTGQLLWQYTLNDAVDQSSPVVVNGMVYVSDFSGNLYAFGLPNQQMSEKFSPPERPDPALLTPNWNLQPTSAITPPLKK